MNVAFSHSRNSSRADLSGLVTRNFSRSDFGNPDDDD